MIYFNASKLIPSVAIMLLRVKPIKIATPPIGGTILVWIFLFSKGSKRCLALATLIIEGTETTTSIKLIINAPTVSINSMMIFWVNNSLLSKFSKNKLFCKYQYKMDNLPCFTYFSSKVVSKLTLLNLKSLDFLKYLIL